MFYVKFSRARCEAFLDKLMESQPIQLDIQKPWELLELAGACVHILNQYIPAFKEMMYHDAMNESVPGGTQEGFDQADRPISKIADDILVAVAFISDLLVLSQEGSYEHWLEKELTFSVEQEGETQHGIHFGKGFKDEEGFRELMESEP
jgi:hypothetical protein